MGYIPDGGDDSTNGYRDYNNDGVRDVAGNPFGIDGVSDANNSVGRAPRYADIVRALED